MTIITKVHNHNLSSASSTKHK